MKTLTLIVAIALMAGCSAKLPKGSLYWGAYSETLYEYKKAPGSETLAQHKSQLENIIQTSERQGYRIPPGVFIELATLYLKEGKVARAEKMLKQEVSLYPEAAPFVEKLRSTYVQASSDGDLNS